MKKLILSYSILLAFGVLFFAAATTTAHAQRPKPDLEGHNKRIIVPTYKNFEPQKFTPESGTSRLSYEVWITTDGVLHCRTSLPLKSASINFISPDVTSKPDANGVSTGTGGGYGHKFDLNKPAGSDAY